MNTIAITSAGYEYEVNSYCNLFKRKCKDIKEEETKGKCHGCCGGCTECEIL